MTVRILISATATGGRMSVARRVMMERVRICSISIARTPETVYNTMGGAWAVRYGRLRRVSACLLRVWRGGCVSEGGIAEGSGSAATPHAVTCMPLLGSHADVHGL
jgi:hypothetical protein